MNQNVSFQTCFSAILFLAFGCIAGAQQNATPAKAQAPAPRAGAVQLMLNGKPMAIKPVVQIGQQITVTVDTGNAAVAITDIVWSDLEDTFKNYRESLEEALLIPLYPEDYKSENGAKRSITFFWSKANEQATVSCDLKVNGKPTHLSAQVSVKKPLSTLVVKTLGHVGIENGVNGLPYLGLWPNINANQEKGITWEGSVATVPGFAPGWWKFVQIAQDNEELVPKAGAVDANGNPLRKLYSIRHSQLSLDTVNPYFTGQPGEVDIKPANGTVHKGEDTPRSLLGGTNSPLGSSRREMDVQTFLLYKPAGTNSSFVPLRKFAWRWIGKAVNGGATWQLSNDPAPEASNGLSVETSLHPEYDTNLDLGGNFPQANHGPLLLTIDRRVNENVGVKQGTIRTLENTTTDLVIGLTSTKPGRIDVPLTVTIPANSKTANFSYSVIDNAIPSDSTDLDITATDPSTDPANWYTETTVSVMVLDND